MTRVMIAVDGSDLDREVAAAAHRLFGDDAQYWAVNVQHFGSTSLGDMPIAVPAMYGGALVGYGTTYPYLPPEPYRVAGESGSEPDGDALTEEERADASAHRVAADAGIADAEVVAEIGDPPVAITRAAREHDVDVIVVGNHERGWWSRLLVSSVTDDLLQTSNIPVLVIKSEEPADD